MFGAIAGLVGGIGGALIGANSQRSANEANSAMAANQIEFQREANDKAMEFSAAEADKANAFSSVEAAKNRDWMEGLSNTAFRRGVADMRAAGLNPMLGYSHGGASTPSGGAPSGRGATGVTSGGASAHIQPAFSPQSFATAAQAAQFGQQIEQGMAMTDKVKAETTNVGEQENLIRAQVIKTLLEANSETKRPQLLEEQTHESRGRTNNLNIDHRLKSEAFWPTIDKLMSEIRHSDASAKDIEQRNFLMKGLIDEAPSGSLAPYLYDWIRSRK